MEVPIYSIKGKASKKSAQLPDAFSEPVRLDLIRKAVRASRANRRQPYGASKGAGFRHSVSWPGKGRGMARTPRKNGGGGHAPPRPHNIVERTADASEVWVGYEAHDRQPQPDDGIVRCSPCCAARAQVQ